MGNPTFTLSLARARERLLPRVYGRAHYLLFALLVAEAFFFVYYGNAGRDEGWYLYASRLVFEGDVPYRDFPYFQGPVLPYLYGLPQLLLGPSLLVGRLTSLVIALAAILAIGYLARSLAGHAALLWALTLAFVNPFLMHRFTSAHPEAPITLLSVLTVVALLRFRQGTPALTVAPALLLLASGMRIVFLPAFLGVLAFVWWTTSATRGRRLLAGGLLASQALVIFGIPLLLAPHRAVFCLWSSQVSRTNQFYPSDPSPGATFLAKVSQLEALWSWYLMVLVPAVALAAYLILLYYRGWEPRRPSFDGDPLSNYLLTLGLALLIFAPHVMLSPIQPHYFVPTSALLTVAVAAAAVRLPPHAILGAVRASFMLLLVTLVLLGAPSYAARYTQFLDVRNPDLVELGDVGDLPASYLDDDEPFVAFDTTLAVAADRPVVPGLEMAQFSYWPAFSTDEAEDLQVFGRDRLIQLLRTGLPGVVALTDWDLMLISWTTRQDELGPPEDEPPFRVLPDLELWYGLTETVPQYGQFRDNLYILVPRAIIPKDVSWR